MASDNTGEESLIDGESLWDLRKNPWLPPSEKMTKLMNYLSYYYKRGERLYCDFYEFDIDGKPSKYEKSDIYQILFELSYELRVNREWFYCYIAKHTNLTDNQSVEAVKRMMLKNNPNKKGNFLGITKGTTVLV